MKKLLLTVAVVGAFAGSVFAQGTVYFANNVTGTLRAPIYGPQTADNSQIVKGNTSAGLPAGTATYTGAALSGSGYLAQLFGVNGAAQAESSLVAQGATSAFRTGTAAGMFVAQTITLTGIAADATAGTFQVRAWDSKGGLYTTWAAAETAWNTGVIAAGKSDVFTINGIGGAVNSTPNLGMTSFNIYYNVPEPTTMALAGLGAAALLIFRRRK